MNPNFKVSRDFPIPQDIQHLEKNYYLQKIESNAGGHTWKLKESTLPSFIKDIYLSLGNFFTPNKYVYNNKLTALMQIAANPKKEYLTKEHIEIFKNADLEELAHENDFQDVARIIPGMETLVTKLRRAVKKAAMAGKGLEQMENQHIQGKALSPDYLIEVGTQKHLYEVDTYLDEWEKSDTQLNFDDWMKQTHDNVALKEVQYLTTDAERLPYRLDFKNGKALRENVPFDTTTETTEHSGVGSAIFVIDANRQFYAGSHIRGTFHHSSFLGGAAIMGAGEIKTNDKGEITHITNKSGHYKPDKQQDLNTLKILQDAGVDLSKVKLTQLTPEGSVFYNSAKAYLEAQGKCPVSGFEGFGIEDDSKGNFTITLDDISLSKDDRLEQLQQTINFLKSQFSVNSLTYKDELKSGQIAEYPIEEYLKNKGKLVPKTWDGGQLKFSQEGKLKQIIANTAVNPSKRQEADLHFLTYLSMQGIDLNDVEFYHEGQREQNLNAGKYLEQLVNDWQSINIS